MDHKKRIVNLLNKVRFNNTLNHYLYSVLSLRMCNPLYLLIVPINSCLRGKAKLPDDVK